MFPESLRVIRGSSPLISNLSSRFKTSIGTESKVRSIILGFTDISALNGPSSIIVRILFNC